MAAQHSTLEMLSFCMGGSVDRLVSPRKGPALEYRAKKPRCLILRVCHPRRTSKPRQRVLKKDPTVEQVIRLLHRLDILKGRRSTDRCDVFPVALGVEAIYLNRRGRMKLMLCAAIGTAHWIDGRSYRPGPSKQQPCSARAIHHSLLGSWHQVRPQT